MARHFLETASHRRAGERGFGVAYFLVLVGVAALLLAGLSELGGLGLARSRLGAERDRARYLALAGAEHAIWRAHHEACFVEQSTGQDFSQALGSGNYTYRVEGSPTHLTVEAVGTIGRASHRVRRSLLTAPHAIRAMAAYGIDDDFPLQAREYTHGVWQSPVSTAVQGKEALWSVLRGCSQRRERLLVSLDTNQQIRLQVWDGGGWTALAMLAADGGSTRCFDLAYEKSSGDALIAYATGGDGDVHFRTWNGTSLSSDQVLDLPFTSPLQWIALASRANSNEIALLALAAGGSSRSLAAVIWNGSSFGAVNVLDTNMYTGTGEPAAVAFLEPSGTAAFVWNTKVLNLSTLRVALWRNSWLMPLIPSLLGEQVRFARLVSRPTGDQARAGFLTQGANLRTITVGSLGFGLPLELVSANLATIDRRCFDLGYLNTGESITAFGMTGNGRPFISTRGALSWGPASPGPNLDANLEAIQLHVDRAVGLVHVGVAADANSGGRTHLQLLTWSGIWSAALANPPEIPPAALEPFMLSLDGDVCPPGALAIGP